MVVGVIFILLGIASIVSGLALPGLIPGTSLLPHGVLVILLGLVFMFLGLAMSWLNLYRKTAANEALVRTGMGGSEVVLDGGIVVFPVAHQVVPVSLETMKLEVERQDQDALITQDNLRVDVKAEFYIRVNPSKEQILQAARSLG